MKEQFVVPAMDGFELSVTVYHPDVPTQEVMIIHSAMAVPKPYYDKFARYHAENGMVVVTYDYRGIGDSKPPTLRGFVAHAHDWAFLDMSAVVDWTKERYQPNRLYFFCHSFGGQVAGILPNHDAVDAMVTVSSQSGYWKIQGGTQKLSVAIHMHLTFPILANVFGYMPWGKFGGEDLPRDVALEWASWCRKESYLLDDEKLPLERFQEFEAPVLAYSFSDDDWGTERAVDAMMRAYPNVERRHIDPVAKGMKPIGHFGFFKSKSELLWSESLQWLRGTSEERLQL